MHTRRRVLPQYYADCYDGDNLKTNLDDNFSHTLSCHRNTSFSRQTEAGRVLEATSFNCSSTWCAGFPQLLNTHSWLFSS